MKKLYVVLFVVLALSPALVAPAASSAANCSKYLSEGGYCTDYIKFRTGKKQSGDAHLWVGNVNVKDARAGDVAIFPYAADGFGHVAYIERANKDSRGNPVSFYISEWNYGSQWVDRACAVTNLFHKPNYRTVQINQVGRVWRP
ncbi:MAG TPA: CHAP domain-containing protein [Blastocatellia bacterium]|nr:CHAP domain-containing protein [Blastocatellia bacterium]